MQLTLNADPLDYYRQDDGTNIFGCGAFNGGGTWEIQASLLQRDITPLNRSEYPTNDLFLKLT